MLCSFTSISALFTTFSNVFVICTISFKHQHFLFSRFYMSLSAAILPTHKPQIGNPYVLPTMSSALERLQKYEVETGNTFSSILGLYLLLVAPFYMHIAGFIISWIALYIVIKFILLINDIELFSGLFSLRFMVLSKLMYSQPAGITQ